MGDESGIVVVKRWGRRKGEGRCGRRRSRKVRFGTETDRSRFDMDLARGRGRGTRGGLESRCTTKGALRGCWSGRSLSRIWSDGTGLPPLQLLALGGGSRDFVNFVTVVRRREGCGIRQLCGGGQVTSLTC